MDLNADDSRNKRLQAQWANSRRDMISAAGLSGVTLLGTGSQMVVGRGRYSLWTGDIGLAIYLWDCITEQPRFPMIDVF
jgi:hypothetical protein